MLEIRLSLKEVNDMKKTQLVFAPIAGLKSDVSGWLYHVIE